MIGNLTRGDFQKLEITIHGEVLFARACRFFMRAGTQK
jgi:hypothetical protein